MKQFRIFISAYACEPGKGSEPEVGWQWAMHLCHHFEVTIMTRTNNREVIERELAKLALGTPRPTWEYYDLPNWLMRWKKFHSLALATYYVLWQLMVRFRMAARLSEFDIIHHLTFNSFRLPGFWWITGKPVVLGPLGGGQVTSQNYLPLFREKTQVEESRTRGVRWSSFNPFFQISSRQATMMLVANAATESAIPKKRGLRIVRMLETGVDRVSIQEPRPKQWKGNLLWVGTLEKWKAGELAIRAFASGLNFRTELRLVMIGDGSDGPFLKALAAELGVFDLVDFRGRCSMEEVALAMKQADLFVFTSVRDTSGNVVLEAMSSGVPVLAIRHHGVAEICTSECAWLIEPGGVQETIDGFVEGIVKLAIDEGKRLQMTQAASKRLSESFVWDSKARIMADLYRELLVNVQHLSDESSS